MAEPETETVGMTELHGRLAHTLMQRNAALNQTVLQAGHIARLDEEITNLRSELKRYADGIEILLEEMQALKNQNDELMKPSLPPEELAAIMAATELPTTTEIPADVVAA